MCTKAEIPWSRYGLIADLADKLSGEFNQLGKTILQKCVYLLQEGMGLNCGYNYEFYTYGPYASQLSQDLDFVEDTGGIQIFANSTFGGYIIEPGPENNFLRDKARDFLDTSTYKNAVSKFISDFRGSNARDLELRSTIVFVERDFKSKGQTPEFNDIIKTVSKLKPKFSESEIFEAVQEMQNKKYLS